MKFLPFILKHLRRNWIRTLSTVLAMAVCIFLFCTLQSVLAAINSLLESTSANRLVTRHAVSLVFNLPLAYGDAHPVGAGRQARRDQHTGSAARCRPRRRARARRRATSSTTDWSNFFPNMAVELGALLRDVPGVRGPARPVPGASCGDLRGAVIGRKLADKFGWKLGDRFFLESFIPPYRKTDGPFEFVVRAIFDADPAKYPGTDTQRDVLPLQVPLRGDRAAQLQAGTYNVEIDDPDQAGAVSSAIDALFENRDAQTHTETEKAFAAGFIVDGRQPRAAAERHRPRGELHDPARHRQHDEHGRARAAHRDRGPEDARLLERPGDGADRGRVAAARRARRRSRHRRAAAASSWLLTNAPGIKDVLAGIGLSELDLQPVVAALGFAVALVLGFAAGFVPALGAYRARDHRHAEDGLKPWRSRSPTTSATCASAGR